ncbi:actin family [Zopfochytrium polystomum]|nr:actin family [Zopfochytrium polystomum]
MINGRVADWNAFEALIKHIVVKELRIRRKKNTHPALIVIPPSWGIPDVELFVQIMFEQMNVPGLFVGDAPVMAAFGCGVLSALVIDIGHDTTSISAVVDCVFQRHASQTIPVGGRTLRTYLATLLKAEPALKDAPIDDAFVKALLESELCEVKPFKEMALPPLVDGTKPVDFEYDGKTYPIGAARFKVMECLFDPSLAKVHEMSIADLAVLVAGASVEQLDKRLALWDSVLLTGGVSPVKGLKERLENELNSRLSASQTSNEFQAKDCKFVKVPEYFLAYKDSPGDITFLGGIITAKHITKADYNEMGPAVFRFKQL